jgi:hypothetical protein
LRSQKYFLVKKEAELQLEDLKKDFNIDYDEIELFGKGFFLK